MLEATCSELECHDKNGSLGEGGKGAVSFRREEYAANVDIARAREKWVHKLVNHMQDS